MRFIVFLIAACLSLAARSQAPVESAPQDPARRVLVVFVPDRDPSLWRGGFPLRINKTIFPGEDFTRRADMPGMDWPKMVLDAYTPALSRKWPQLTFVPAPALSEKLSPAPEPASEIRSVGLQPGWMEWDQRRDIVLAEMKANNCATAVLFRAQDRADYDRHNDFGGFLIVTQGVRDGVASRHFSRWTAYVRWIGTVQAMDTKGRALGSSGFGGMTGWPGSSNDLPGFEGTEEELRQQIANTKTADILDAVQKRLVQGADPMAKGFYEGLERDRDRSPGLWNMPFLPKQENLRLNDGSAQ